ncbi:hypothetical protein EVAR_11067_1 [Eumeta japonica]|uniref:Retrovirus-related Pol polyprotein from type-1 retrotransposable element R1 n=1 Tax=Eumeta variegata TaxID=151549 RepID=A0A4C1U5B5_EUMVA|nr:hypothetical protein EVAR_11067_1 [Eumeta japonica]
MPIGPYLDRVRYVCSKLGTDKIILGAMSTRGVYGDRLLKSVVDVTACSSALLDRAEGWQVVRDVTSSDHNAVTFAVRVEGRSGPRPLSGTRVYNTAKARWSEFGTAMDVALNERTLTTEIVKSVGSCDQLDERAETRCAQKAAHPKCGPGRREYVVGEYVQARRFTKGQWLRRRPRAGNGFALHRMERACGTASTGSSGKREKPEGCPIKTDSGQVIGPDESATLLAETFFPDDRVDTDDPYYTEVRRRTDGSSQPPEASGDLLGVDPPFTGAEIRFALKAFHPRKAPGIDGFTSDICQAAIFRDVGLFLAMANKCLELGYVKVS